jgi:hypothetical protein
MDPVCCRIQFNLFHSLLLFPRKRRAKTGEMANGFSQGGYTSPSAHLDFLGCYVQLKAVLRVAH